VNTPLKIPKPCFRLLAEVFRFGAWWIVFSGACSTFEHTECGSLSCQQSSSLSLTQIIIAGGVFAFVMTVWRHFALKHSDKNKESNWTKL